MTTEPSAVFSSRLREARQLRELSQSDLASKADLPPTSISHFESGKRKPSFDNLRRIANALNVTTDYLIGRVSSPELATAADPIYRDVQNLSDADRELAQDFLKMLASRRK